MKMLTFDEAGKSKKKKKSKTVVIFNLGKKTLADRKITNLPPSIKICIFKNMALIYYEL